MSRTIDDLPPIASDEELIEWGRQLNARPTSLDRPVGPPVLDRVSRPLVAQRATENLSPEKLSTEEILLDISERATAVFERRHVSVRRSSLAGRTSTS